MNLLPIYTTHFGRLTRPAWIGHLIWLSLFCGAFGLLCELLFGNVGAAIVAFGYLWCACALSIQRLHDVGRSGLSLLFFLIPVLGPLWLLLQLLRPSFAGTNIYGANPQLHRDYLQVDISR